jgi:hypothetical protein
LSDVVKDVREQGDERMLKMLKEVMSRKNNKVDHAMQ